MHRTPLSFISRWDNIIPINKKDRAFNSLTDRGSLLLKVNKGSWWEERQCGRTYWRAASLRGERSNVPRDTRLFTEQGTSATIIRYYSKDKSAL